MIRVGRLWQAKPRGYTDSAQGNMLLVVTKSDDGIDEGGATRR
jgi:hypothetical protein